MPPRSLTLDTSPEIEERQVEAWRCMSPAEKAAVVTGLTQAAYDLARAGIAARYPDASSRERHLRLAIGTLGLELARKPYPEIDALDVR